MSENIQTSPSSKPKTQSEKSRWRNMVALAFGYFVDQGEGQAMSVLFPTLRAMWGLSFSDLGLVGTIKNLLQSISAPLWGYIADRYPRKNVIVFGTGIWGIWTLMVGFTTTFGQLLWIRRFIESRVEFDPLTIECFGQQDFCLQSRIAGGRV